MTAEARPGETLGRAFLSRARSDVAPQARAGRACRSARFPAGRPQRDADRTLGENPPVERVMGKRDQLDGAGEDGAVAADEFLKSKFVSILRAGRAVMGRIFFVFI